MCWLKNRKWFWRQYSLYTCTHKYSQRYNFGLGSFPNHAALKKDTDCAHTGCAVSPVLLCDVTALFLHQKQHAKSHFMLKWRDSFTANIIQFKRRLFYTVFVRRKAMPYSVIWICKSLAEREKWVWIRHTHNRCKVYWKCVCFPSAVNRSWQPSTSQIIPGWNSTCGGTRTWWKPWLISLSSQRSRWHQPPWQIYKQTSSEQVKRNEQNPAKHRHTLSYPCSTTWHSWARSGVFKVTTAAI